MFRSINFIPARSILIAANVRLSYFKVNCKQISPSETNTCLHHIKWNPSPGFIKLNFDGSVRMEKEVVAFVLRNEEGQPVDASAFNLDCTTIPVVEAVALKESLLYARRKGFRNLMVEWDSMLVIHGARRLGYSLAP